MAAAVASPALTWYAALLSRRITEFTAADFPEIPDRTLRHYIGQIRQGWCEIQVVRRGSPTVYGLPAAVPDDADAVPVNPASRDAFVSLWSARVEAAALPSFAAGDYEAVRTLYPDIPVAEFERLLLSKLLQRAGSPPPPQTTAGLVSWLTRGIGMAQRATQAPAGGTGNGFQSPQQPPQKTPEELYQEFLPEMDARRRLNQEFEARIAALRRQNA
jgi:hypothetical protein